MPNNEVEAPELRQLFHPCYQAVCSYCGNMGHPYCSGRVIKSDGTVVVCTCYCHELKNPESERANRPADSLVNMVRSDSGSHADPQATKGNQDADQ